jgi:hypothetical protein
VAGSRRTVSDMATADWDTLSAWIDGDDIPLLDVRRILGTVAEQCAEAARSVIPEGVDRSEAIDQLAAILAASRSNSIVPRVARMSLADRTDGCGYFLAIIAGPDSEVERRHEDAEHFERMIGLRTGHAGGLAEAASLHVDPQDLAPLRATGGLRDAIAGSTDDELELARLAVVIFRDWVPLLMPMLTAQFGAKGVGMEKLVRHVHDQGGSSVHRGAAAHVAAPQDRNEGRPQRRTAWDHAHSGVRCGIP